MSPIDLHTNGEWPTNIKLVIDGRALGEISSLMPRPRQIRIGRLTVSWRRHKIIKISGARVRELREHVRIAWETEQRLKRDLPPS